MLASPFAFYRGAPAVMAHDLAHTPSSGIVVQLCGDCHISNFGMFASPERDLVFDLNDFDETLPGPFEWDVKRTAASIVVAARNARLSGKDAKAAVRTALRLYRKSIHAFAAAELSGHLVQSNRGERLAGDGPATASQDGAKPACPGARQRPFDKRFPS